MKASAFEFHYRLLIILIIYALGFLAPWDLALHLDGLGPNAHVWGLLSVLLSKSGAMSIGTAFNAVLVVAILLGLLGATLRTWGSAHLGADVMRDSRMHGEAMVADGPYRHVRNPLYVGWLIFSVLLTLLMPASGAIFSLGAMIFFYLRLILGEESFLTAKLGAPYIAYCARVPRIFPALRARVETSGAKPRWAQAFAAEIFMWGAIASFAVLGWRYNALLLDQCMLVWLGLSIVIHAFAKSPSSTEQPAA